MNEKRMLVEKAWWSWITETRSLFFSFFSSFCCVTFARLHAVFGHGGANDLVFCGLETFDAHFCKRFQIDALNFLFMRLSLSVASSCAAVFYFCVCLFMWLRMDSKVNWRKVSPFLYFSCVNNHTVFMIIHNQICTTYQFPKGRCGWKNYIFFSDSGNKRRARHLEKSFTYRLGGAWCSF